MIRAHARSRGAALRAGATLAELLVALTITAVVAAAGSVALLAAERQFRATAVSSDDERALRDAETVLRAELRAADRDSILLRGDTAVEFFTHVGASVGCVLSARLLVLAPEQSSTGFPYSVWRATPSPGDVVLVADSATAGGWFRAAIDSSASRSDGAGCRPGSGLMTPADSASHVPATRLVLSRELPAGAVMAAPVRVLRRGRYALVKGSDKSWALSFRTCDGPGICGPSQPVVGPLAASSDSGLVFRYDSVAGTLSIDLRAPRRTNGARAPSRRLLVPLANHRTHAP